MLIRQCLDRRIDNIREMRDEVAAWQHARNNAGSGIDWQFTTCDALFKPLDVDRWSLIGERCLLVEHQLPGAVPLDVAAADYGPVPLVCAAHGTGAAGKNRNIVGRLEHAFHLRMTGPANGQSPLQMRPVALDSEPRPSW